MKLCLFCILLTSSFLLPASAAVVFTTLNTPIPMTIDGVYLNPLTGATVTTLPSGWNTEPWMNPFFGGVDVATDDLFLPVITGASTIVNLASGTVIDGTLTFATAESGSSDHTAAVVMPNMFTLGTPGYLGFQFKPTTSSTDVFYGWASVTFNNTGTGIITSYAWNDSPNTGILAGDIGLAPEPSRALLLVVGSLGVLLRRRRSVFTL